MRTALKMAGIAATCENWTAIRRESTRSPSPEKGAGRMRAVPQRMIRAIARVLPTKRVRRGATPQSSTWLRRRATLDTGFPSQLETISPTPIRQSTIPSFWIVFTFCFDIALASRTVTAGDMEEITAASPKRVSCDASK